MRRWIIFGIAIVIVGSIIALLIEPIKDTGFGLIAIGFIVIIIGIVIHFLNKRKGK
jgi:uncharacterized membrane protein